MMSWFKTGKKLAENFEWPLTSVAPMLILMLLILLGIYYIG